LNREKTATAICSHEKLQFLEDRAAEKWSWNKIAAWELVPIAAMRGGGDPNETIYQSRLYRRGAGRLGDSGIRDAARSGKRPCH
jgi:hypothetical protein